MVDLYNTAKAQTYRKDIEKIANEVAELQYKLFIKDKELRKLDQEYRIYLGIIGKDEKKDGKS